MNEFPVSILYTRDDALATRLKGYLHDRSRVLAVCDPAELKLLLMTHSPVAFFADLRGTGCAPWLPAIKREFPEVVIIALGEPRSDPVRMVTEEGLYGTESPEAGRTRIQELFDQVQRYIHLLQENRILREERNSPPPTERPKRDPIAPSLADFSGALRRFDNLDNMLENIVEGIADSARVARVGIFSKKTGGTYRFQAGVKSLPCTRDLVFEESDPFVRWLQVHAHGISRSMLRHIDSLDERLLLERNLERQGAEILFPLFGRNRLLGWLCLGRLSSGVPFEQLDIEDLSLLAEQVSIVIENSLLHETLAVQKVLAETLLQTIPVGIVAAGEEGTIQWFNCGAEHLLGVAAEEMIGQPVKKTGSVIASQLTRCMHGKELPAPVEWVDPLTRRELSIHVRRLQQNGHGMGAMAVIKDLTEERIFLEKMNNLERTQFWNELAGAISHEVRNPLVAINTFSQLLPEKYADEEFRTRFRDLTIQEVERLNTIVDQLDQFANPPTLRFGPVSLPALFEKALTQARKNQDPIPEVEVSLPRDIPPLRADSEVLADAVARILQNAFDAVKATPAPRVVLNAVRDEIGIGRPAVVITVRDNGTGIPDDLNEKLFSPFCTTKPRGVGLGLPIVRRTLIDHEGLVAIDSDKTGTTVRIILPVYDERRD